MSDIDAALEEDLGFFEDAGAWTTTVSWSDNTNDEGVLVSTDCVIEPMWGSKNAQIGFKMGFDINPEKSGLEARVRYYLQGMRAVLIKLRAGEPVTMADDLRAVTIADIERTLTAYGLKHSLHVVANDA